MARHVRAPAVNMGGFVQVIIDLNHALAVAWTVSRGAAAKMRDTNSGALPVECTENLIRSARLPAMKEVLPAR